jgi:LmbE family N-acetylglucosaminyl deacetylase
VKWIYLSPHLDDVALSCGGGIWEQTRAGHEVEVWTLCAGDPPPGALSPFAAGLHARWAAGEQAILRRRQEDRHACALLGAAVGHFPAPDCIYRRSPVDGRPLYTSEEDLFGALAPDDQALVGDLTRQVRDSLPAAAQVAAPLGLGNHVDHQLTKQVAEGLGRPLWFYAEYPYLMQDEVWRGSGEPQFSPAGWEALPIPVSQEGLQAWQDAVATHATQISTFWPDTAAMQSALAAYHGPTQSVRLWRPQATLPVH